MCRWIHKNGHLWFGGGKTWCRIEYVLLISCYYILFCIFQFGWQFNMLDSVRDVIFDHDETALYSVSRNRAVCSFDVETGVRYVYMLMISCWFLWFSDFRSGRDVFEQEQRGARIPFVSCRPRLWGISSLPPVMMEVRLVAGCLSRFLCFIKSV